MKKRGFIAGVVLLGATWPVVGTAAEKDTEALVEYEAGFLVLNPDNQLPDDLNFGSHPIQTASAEQWVATSDGVQTSPVTTGAIEISDNRGDESGWIVKLAQMEQFATDDAIELDDAMLLIQFGSITNNLGSDFTFSQEGLDVPVPIATAIDLIVADEGEGIGETSLEIDQFVLDILADTQKVPEQYTTELNWTIEAGE